MLQSYLPEANQDSLDEKLDSLGLGSMDFISLVYDIEEKYGVEVDLAEVNMSMTIRQLTDSLR